MPWVTPRTWTTAELVTAAMMNEQIRDNLGILKDTVFNDDGEPTGAIYAARQTADVTFNNDDVLDDLDDFSFPIGASQTWMYIGGSGFTSNGTAHVQWSTTAPAGASGGFGVTGTNPGVSTMWETTFGNSINMQVPNTQDNMAILFGFVVNGVTAGTVQIQGAQNTATVVNTIFYENSGLVAVRLF